jgi:hypothetical protein
MVVETPADAFALLGSDIRIDILRALAEASPDGFGERALSFSGVYERVGVEDTGQLSYHLDELVGHFVRKDEAGYGLRYAGWKVVWAIRAGTFLGSPRRTFDAPGTCYACDEPALRARTGDDWLVVDCAACDTRHTANPLAPRTLEDRAPEEVLRVFDTVVRHRVSFATDRICPECNGRVEPSIRVDVPDAWDVGVVPSFACTHCGYWFTPSFGMLLLEDRRVERFLLDRGVDPDARPYWDLPVCIDPGTTAVRGRDPWRVEVVVSADGDRLRATFDGDATVREVSVEA